MTDNMSPPHEAPSNNSWPTVVGVISIVWAGLCLLPPPLSLHVGRVPDWYHCTAGFPVEFVSALLLMVTGICLLNRTCPSRVLHMTYAGVNIALRVVGLVIMLTVEFASFLEGGMPEGYVIVDICGAIVYTVVVMAWPIFLLVWFRRPKIRQQVQQW